MYATYPARRDPAIDLFLDMQMFSDYLGMDLDELRLKFLGKIPNE